MERETFVSGYCRQLDCSRMVAVEADGPELTEVDCSYPDCPYTSGCTVAKKIQEFLEAE